jgi:hypothetical protein
MLPSPLSCFVSVGTLKTGRLFSVDRLPWAQEVSGSNPDAPTNLLIKLKAPGSKNQDFRKSGGVLGC